MPNSWNLDPVFIPQGDPEGMNEPSLLEPGQLGVRFQIKNRFKGISGIEDVRFKGYQIVQTDSSMTVAPFPGAVAWWSDRITYKVTTSPTNRNSVAGVFQNAITPGNYGCVQVLGPALVKFVDAPTAAVALDSKAIPSATAGKADNLAAATAPTYIVLGIAQQAILGSDSTAVVYLNIPDTV